MPTNQPITVRLMHADALLVAGMGAILSSHKQIALSSSDGGPADVIVADYYGGLQLCEQQAGAVARNGARVLIVTQFDKEWAVRQAMKLGAHGYLLQNCGSDELLRAVRALKSGRRYLSPAVACCVADSLSRTELTGRETDVLRCLAKGYCNKTIARELDIGVGTVKSHLRGLMGKLNATARTHAVVLASERGLIGNGAATDANGGAHHAAR